MYYIESMRRYIVFIILQFILIFASMNIFTKIFVLIGLIGGFVIDLLEEILTELRSKRKDVD